MKQAKIHIPKEKIAEFCRRNHIKKLALFGSVLREDFQSGSDIDVLVEFEADHVPGFLSLASLEKALSKLFGGRKVDMRTPQELSKYFRDEVIASAEIQYG
jgi:predicted nucleotidyltransferase